MKLFVVLFLVAAVRAKIVIEKWEMQVDPKIAEVKHVIKDQTTMSVDAKSLIEADDIVVRENCETSWKGVQSSPPQIHVAAYSKVDGVYNPFVRPDPIHVCKIHEHEDPLVSFMHEEILKFGNVTKVAVFEFTARIFLKKFLLQACPLHNGAYYYLHDFQIDEAKFPVPLPEGEFRVDINASIVEGGKETHSYNSELFFKTVKD